VLSSLNLVWDFFCPCGDLQVSDSIIKLYIRAISSSYMVLFIFPCKVCAWLVETFSPEARLTSVAVGYNIALALVGGTTPALATYLVDAFSVETPSYMISFVAILSLIGLYLAPDKQYIPDPPTPLAFYGRMV